MENSITSKQNQETSRYHYSNIRQTDLTSKVDRRKKSSQRSLKTSLHTEDWENLCRHLYHSKRSAVNTDAHNFTKQILLNTKPQTNPNTVIMDHFNTPLSQIKRTFKTCWVIVVYTPLIPERGRFL